MARGDKREAEEELGILISVVKGAVGRGRRVGCLTLVSSLTI